MARFAIKGWAEFQHYKDRVPPWIKLHRGLLDNLDYYELSPEAGKALPLIWLIASEYDGSVPEFRRIAFRLRISDDLAERILNELCAAQFLVLAEAPEGVTPVTSKGVAAKNGFGSRHIPDAIKRDVWARDGGKCRDCESTDDIEYDHVVPVSKEGPSTVENVQLLCRSCNRRKRNKLSAQAEQPATQVLSSRSLEAEAEAEIETEEEGETEGEVAAPSVPAKPIASRGSRLPADWRLPDDWRAWARTERDDLDIQKTADVFRDYWIAQPGQKGVKTDWPATWRNWVRRQNAERQSGKSKTMQALDDIERSLENASRETDDTVAGDQREDGAPGGREAGQGVVRFLPARTA